MNRIHEDLGVTSDLTEYSLDTAMIRLREILGEAEVKHYQYRLSLKCCLLDYQSAARMVFSNEQISDVTMTKQGKEVYEWRLCFTHEDTEYSVGSPGA